jgi:hypothetical protein
MYTHTTIQYWQYIKSIQFPLMNEDRGTVILCMLSAYDIKSICSFCKWEIYRKLIYIVVQSYVKMNGIKSFVKGDLINTKINNR